MGMFNSIFADLVCPVTKATGKHVEIQIKWQHHHALGLTAYQPGDALEELDETYNNTWIRTDYICPCCSKMTTGKQGTAYIKTEDQQWHFVFLKIENTLITNIVSEIEFNTLGITTFVKDECCYHIEEEE